MRLFGISDLHLSLGVDKPMDIFGPQWQGHEAKMRTAWDAMVAQDDWVMCGGDASWGLTLAEAKADLDWLGARPGNKVLIRGNPCPWGPPGTGGRAKLHRIRPPSIPP